MTQVCKRIARQLVETNRMSSDMIRLIFSSFVGASGGRMCLVAKEITKLLPVTLLTLNSRQKLFPQCVSLSMALGERPFAYSVKKVSHGT